MALHIVSKSPFERSAFHSCMRTLACGDAVLFIGDGVYGALDSAELSEALIKAPSGVIFHALSADIAARGIEHQLNAAVERVDETGFVQLTEKHRSCVSWF